MSARPGSGSYPGQPFAAEGGPGQDPLDVPPHAEPLQGRQDRRLPDRLRLHPEDGPALRSRPPAHGEGQEPGRGASTSRSLEADRGRDADAPGAGASRRDRPAARPGRGEPQRPRLRRRDRRGRAGPAGLPGNRDAGAILEKARGRRTPARSSRWRASARSMALEGHQPARRRPRSRRCGRSTPTIPSVALLERRLTTASRAAPWKSASRPTPGFSLVAPGEPAAPARRGGGLGELSLDSLSLDEPLESPAVVPPPDFGTRDPATGPCRCATSEAPGPPPAIDAGGPPDLWSEAPADEREPPTADGYPAAFSMRAAGGLPSPSRRRRSRRSRPCCAGATTRPAAATASRRSRSGRASS